ncbi:N-acetylmuramic acid/N-acetylglucosamine kinase [Cohnella abietis]|uniref:N-acetylmuramic acid/N-acetylglucosamine kinase n=1 Tax=Cohnella abietis TaxID=2507935 RepID=A0A3T1DEA0_9BACL|nr:N-acetylmuramic acid/N-acetylglucosamine kinase [Cohnella abietis]
MKYVIGIDGGGTKSLLHMMDLEGNLLLELRGGPTNIYATSEQAVEQELTELLSQMVEASGRSIADCVALCLGSAGVDRPYEKQVLSDIFRKCGVTGILTITHDAEAVLVAGTGKQEGITLVSGTGSFGFARDLEGNRARTGGWGHLIGDEGGGYDIGINAIKAAVRSEDGREAPTLLLPMLMKEIGLERPEQFLQYVYKTAGKPQIAALAKVVSEAYLAGDVRAKRILEDAASELYLKTSTLVRALHFENRPITLVANGSVFTHIHYVYERLSHLIKSSYPEITVVKPTLPAAHGAALIALQSLPK